jgi:hypothetical protein
VHEPEILIEVKCPECGQSTLACLPVAAVADALISGSGFRLSGKCHSAEWEASPADIATIRAQLRTNSIHVQTADAGTAVGPLTPRRGVYSGTGIVRQIERAQYLRKPPDFFPPNSSKAGSGADAEQAAPCKAQPQKQRWARVGKVFTRIRGALSAQARRVLVKPAKYPEVRAGR